MPENLSSYFGTAAGAHKDFLYYAYDPGLSGDPLEVTTVTVGPGGVVSDAFIQTCCGTGQPGNSSGGVLAFIDP
jgi:hypothetical protein